MNVNEFKIHLMRGLVRPEYFYIPILKQNDEEQKHTVYIEVFDTEGNHLNVKGITIYYNKYQLYHLIQKNDDDTYTTIRDNVPKGYAFEQDFEWRYPPAVPDPSDYEIYPVPDFANDPPIVQNSETVSVSDLRISFKFSERYLIELSNMPVGSYTINVTVPFSATSVQYYPDYYNEYTSPHTVSHSSGSCQIDKNGSFSGFNYYQYTHPQYNYPNGYDFYCITQKFQNNTMPVVMTKKSEYYKIIVTWIDVPNLTSKSFSTFQIRLLDDTYYGDKAYTTIHGNGYVGKRMGLKFYKNDIYIGEVAYNGLLEENIPIAEVSDFDVRTVDDKDYIGYNCSYSVTDNWTVNDFMGSNGLIVVEHSGYSPTVSIDAFDPVCKTRTGTINADKPTMMKGHEQTTLDDYGLAAVSSRTCETAIVSVSKVNVTITANVICSITASIDNETEKGTLNSTATFSIKTLLDLLKRYPDYNYPYIDYTSTMYVFKQQIGIERGYAYYVTDKITEQVITDFYNALMQGNCEIDFEN